jgi:hypothetical protein
MTEIKENFSYLPISPETQYNSIYIEDPIHILGLHPSAWVGLKQCFLSRILGLPTELHTHDTYCFPLLVT